MYKEVEYEDWNRIQRLKNKKIKRIIHYSENEYDTYYDDNDRDK